MALPVIGALIGAGLALVEEAAKEHWLVAFSGARVGHSYILSKAQTTVGRHELSDVPCFGDPTVEKLHARILIGGGTVQIVAEPGQTVRINGRSVTAGALSDGDFLHVGEHLFRFRNRRVKKAAGAGRHKAPRRASSGPAWLCAVASDWHPARVDAPRRP